jgi:hypothetical protein
LPLTTRAASGDGARKRPRRPAFARIAAELAGHVALLGVDKVCEVLGVRAADLAALLEGRAAPPAEGMRRLRAAAE